MGPVAWVLIFPTTKKLMQLFLEKKISEKQLFESTPVGAAYEVIYLCSAMVLQEYRSLGIAKRLAINSLEQIRKDHVIEGLFVWAFTIEGERLANQLADTFSLPIFFR